MDKSKLPKMSPKSSEAPWEPTDKSRAHERKRLSDRAGSVTRRRTGFILRGDRRTWVPGDSAQKPYSDKFLGLPMSNIVEGKGKKKKRGEESEY